MIKNQIKNQIFINLKQDKMYKQILAVILVVIFGFSCNNSENSNKSSKDNDSIVENSKTDNSSVDISGYYTLPETGCNIALTITKDKSGFKYYFKGDNLDLEGIAILSNEDGTYYVTFDGPIGNYPPKTVSGQFSENTLTIQNYGNSMNDYTYFKDCQEKYLEFKKN